MCSSCRRCAHLVVSSSSLRRGVVVVGARVLLVIDCDRRHPLVVVYFVSPTTISCTRKESWSLLGGQVSREQSAHFLPSRRKTQSSIPTSRQTQDLAIAAYTHLFFLCQSQSQSVERKSTTGHHHGGLLPPFCQHDITISVEQSS